MIYDWTNELTSDPECIRFPAVCSFLHSNGTRISNAVVFASTEEEVLIIIVEENGRQVVDLNGDLVKHLIPGIPFRILFPDGRQVLSKSLR